MARVAALACLVFLALAPAHAEGVVTAEMPAHPALWTVHGAKGTAYLLGSIHLLPPQVDWHTKEIDAALAKADVLVFELKMDDAFQQRVQDYIQERGLLPPGEHLRDMLPPKERSLFDARTSGLSVPQASIDRMRPWLAALTLDFIALQKQGYAAKAGIEMELKQDPRPVIGLETVETQMALLAPRDPKTELQSLEATLAEQKTGSADEMGPLLDAWMDGDVARLDTLANDALKHYPKARKLLLDDRNRAWVKALMGLLNEDKIYFVTVGAAHLVGPRGVPNLLRAKGLHVEGP